MLIVATCTLVLGIGCQDRDPAAPRQKPRAAVEAGPLVFPRSVGIDCRRAGVGNFVCTVSGAAVASPDRARPAVVIPPVWPNGYLSLSVRNKRFDGDTLSVEIGVVNLLGQPMGTLDGATALGMKVFLWEPPQALDGSGAVTMVGAEGSEAFRTDTTGVEPYLTYAGMVAPQDTSAERTWRFLMPPGLHSMHFALGVSAAIPAETNVALTPPTSIPAWVHADSNVGGPTSVFHGRFARGIVVVRFRNGASLVDRQLAVAMIGGTVVGGLSSEANGDGPYFVHIADPDLSGRAMLAAALRLRDFPQVLSAGIDPAVSIQWLDPKDGQDWRLWKHSPDRADTASPRWALEMIDAPMAWGCSTGDSTLKIGIIDHGFRRPADLVGILPASGYVYNATDTVTHATEVSSVLGARGNNDSGMTGVLWRSKLLVQDVQLDTGVVTGGIEVRTMFPEAIGDRVIRLAGSGARVVNISLGADWRDSSGNYYAPRDTSRSDSLIANDIARRLLEATRSARKGAIINGAFVAYSGPLPLLVIAAGNFFYTGNNARTDSWWSGFPQLRDSLGDSVLVVGASTKSISPAWFSGANINHSYVDIMAPGENVFVMGGDGNILADNGTSFATPHVTGVAGLVLSFDPGFTGGPPELKRLILAGADSNKGPDGQPRRAGAYRFLNAYETLKQAARRPGAPLCGNRVWAANGAIFAERSTGPEQVGTTTAPLTYLSVAHGGRRIDFADTAFRALLWNSSGTWQVSSSNPPSDQRDGGATLAAFGISHNLDSTVAVTIATTESDPAVPASTQRVRVTLNGSTPLGTLDVALGPAGQTICRIRQTDNGVCLETRQLPPTEQIRSSSLAYPQNAGGIVVALNRYRATVDLYAGSAEDDLGIQYTLTGALYRWVPIESDVYTVSPQGGSLTSTGTLTGSAVFRIALAEAGDEVAVGMGRDSVVTDYGFSGQDARVVTTCAAQFRPIAYGATGTWGAAVAPVADAQLCANLSDGFTPVFGGTYSPVIAGGSGGRAAPARLSSARMNQLLRRLGYPTRTR